MEIAGKEGYRHILASSVVFESLPTAALDHISARGLLVEMQAGEPVLAEGTRLLIGTPSTIGEFIRAYENVPA